MKLWLLLLLPFGSVLVAIVFLRRRWLARKESRLETQLKERYGR